MKYLQAIITGMIGAIILVGSSSTSAAQDAKPNIILLMVEDIGNDLTRCGAQGVVAQILDKLAEEGTQYTRFYTNSPICSPSRTSQMLGMYQTS
ncbi:MAG: arylsulfatase A-like enzyme [Mariniblastus sp.]|jgi:arylsulfatase A-like enzyme